MNVLPWLAQMAKDGILTVRGSRNWYEVAAVRLGVKNKATITFRNGSQLPLSRSSGLWGLRCFALANLNGIRLDYEPHNRIRFQLDNTTFESPIDMYAGKLVEYAARLFISGCRFPKSGTISLPNGVVLKYPPGDISALCHIWETFFGQAYSLLNVRGKTVVDVGASLGDSSIYFAMQGAARVFAFEPFYEVYGFLLENINANRLTDKVCPRMVAVSAKEGRMYVKPEIRWFGGTRCSSTASGGGHWVKSERLQLKADILKMDCEGCEYDVLSSIDPRSMRYEEIMIEFHKGSSPIVRVLAEARYESRVISEYGKGSFGMLYARRRD